MKTIKARSIKDEPVTSDVLAQAIAHGRRKSNSALRAKGVRYMPELKALAVRFSDQSAILLPVKKYEEFAHLTADQLGRLEIGFAGSALCLDECDLHVSIVGLVSASQALMALASTVVAASNGRQTSTAKARASRENGKKGGRPRKEILRA